MKRLKLVLSVIKRKLNVCQNVNNRAWSLMHLFYNRHTREKQCCRQFYFQSRFLWVLARFDLAAFLYFLLFQATNEKQGQLIHYRNTRCLVNLKAVSLDLIYYISLLLITRTVVTNRNIGMSVATVFIRP